jgi:hypothetical protein
MKAIVSKLGFDGRSGSGTVPLTVVGYGLFLIGLIKLASSLFGTTLILDNPDPIIGIKNRHLMVAIGVIEIATAIILLFTSRTRLKAYLTAMLFTSFLAYRGSVWLAGESAKPCPCLGDLFSFKGISPVFFDSVLKLFLAFGLLSGYYFVLKCRKEAKNS